MSYEAQALCLVIFAAYVASNVGIVMRWADRLFFPTEQGPSMNDELIQCLRDCKEMCESPATRDSDMDAMADRIGRLLAPQPTPADRQGFEPFNYTERS